MSLTATGTPSSGRAARPGGLRRPGLLRGPLQAERPERAVGVSLDGAGEVGDDLDRRQLPRAVAREQLSRAERSHATLGAGEAATRGGRVGLVEARVEHLVHRVLVGPGLLGFELGEALGGQLPGVLLLDALQPL